MSHISVHYEIDMFCSGKSMARVSITNSRNYRETISNNTRFLVGKVLFMTRDENICTNIGMGR